MYKSDKVTSVDVVAGECSSVIDKHTGGMIGECMVGKIGASGV